MFVTPFLQGFGASAGLIVAIGAQNAYLLSQSVQGNHHLVIALICILCDGLFITLGVAGAGSIVAANLSLSRWIVWGGAAFLMVYGFRSLRSAIRGGSLEIAEEQRQSLQRVVATTLAVTLLNPHFYLDTVILLGGISSQFPGELRFYFWIGAVCASTMWFLGLGMGGRILAPVFRTRMAWRIMDSAICVIMWGIGASLFMSGLAG